MLLALKILNIIAFTCSILSISLVMISICAVLVFYSHTLSFKVFSVYIPGIIPATVISIFFLATLIYLVKYLRRKFLIKYEDFEKSFFGKKNFFIPSVIQAKKEKLVEILLDQKDIIKKLVKFSTIKTSISLLITLFFICLSIISWNLGNYYVKDLIDFLSLSHNLTYSEFFSDDIPLNVKLKPKYQIQKAFLNFSNDIVELSKHDDTFEENLYPKNISTEYRILAHKYGLLLEISKFRSMYIPEFSIVSSRVKVFFKGKEIFSQDYSGYIELVSGSEILFEFVFSRKVKSVYSPYHNLKIYSNVVFLKALPNKSTVIQVKVEDTFGKNLIISNLVYVKTNSPPKIVFSSPNKDLKITSSQFSVEFAGEILDEEEIKSATVRIISTNKLTEYVKIHKSFLIPEKENFNFTISSEEYNFSPGDIVNIEVLAKDIYESVGKGSRVLNFPTFSELAKEWKESTEKISKDTQKDIQNITEIKKEISKNELTSNKLLEISKKLKSIASNFANSTLNESQNIIENYKYLDETLSIISEINRFENIINQLSNILTTEKISELVESFRDQKEFILRKSEHLDSIEKIRDKLTELEFQVNRLKEFSDAISLAGDIKELGKMLKEEIKQDKLSEKIREITKKDQFKNLASEIKNSLMEKLKMIENMKKSQKLTKESIDKIIEEMSFELFREMLKNALNMVQNQKKITWEAYTNILNIQKGISEAKKFFSTKSIRYPRINVEISRKYTTLINQLVKDYRENVSKLLNSIVLDPSYAQIYNQLRDLFIAFEENFYMFNLAISSGITLSIYQNLDHMILTTSKTLSKILDIIDKINENMQISAGGGVSMEELIELQQKISEMLSKLLGQEVPNQESLSKLEELIKQAISKAEELGNKYGISEANEIKKNLEELFEKVKTRKLDESLTKSKSIENNLLEYQKGMFKKGISAKFEAEKPKPFKLEKTTVDKINYTELFKNSPFRKEYIEIINNYKKILEEEK